MDFRGFPENHAPPTRHRSAADPTDEEQTPGPPMNERDTTNMVRKYRRWNEMSQADLAERVGVTRQTIANIERGNYSPSVHLALDICRALGRTVEQIFGDEQEGQPQ